MYCSILTFLILNLICYSPYVFTRIFTVILPLHVLIGAECQLLVAPVCVDMDTYTRRGGVPSRSRSSVRKEVCALLTVLSHTL